MKYFFFLIVILNILLFLWQYKTQPLPSEQVRKVPEYKQKIQLMKEIEKGSQASTSDSEQE